MAIGLEINASGIRQADVPLALKTNLSNISTFEFSPADAGLDPGVFTLGVSFIDDHGVLHCSEPALNPRLLVCPVEGYCS